MLPWPTLSTLIINTYPDVERVVKYMDTSLFATMVHFIVEYAIRRIKEEVGGGVKIIGRG